MSDDPKWGPSEGLSSAHRYVRKLEQNAIACGQEAWSDSFKWRITEVIRNLIDESIVYGRKIEEAKHQRDPSQWPTPPPPPTNGPGVVVEYDIIVSPAGEVERIDAVEERVGSGDNATFPGGIVPPAPSRKAKPKKKAKRARAAA